MPSDHSIVARAYEAFNARDFDAFSKLLAQDVEFVMAGVTLRGARAVTGFMFAATQARPGLQVERGLPGDRSLAAWACDLYRVSEGRITEWHVYHDPVGEELAGTAFITLAAEQSALRRVAELIARNASLDAVFPVVTTELMELLGVDHVRAVRFEPDETATVIAADGFAPDVFAVDAHPPTGEGTVLERVLHTGAPARVDDYAGVAGASGEFLRQADVGAVAGAPILVAGHIWGGIVVAASFDGELPPQAESRLAQFADLISMAISNSEARVDIERLAAEQFALRRVATLVAREAALDELFPVLAREIRVLLGVDAVVIDRTSPEGPAALLAVDADGTGAAVQWTRIHLDPELDSTSCPIVVDGTEWGTISIASRSPRALSFDAARRLYEFARHAAMAVAAARRRADLTESRARIVRAGDDARRRFERDLHDGAQQQLVSIGLELRTLEARLPDQLSDVQATLSALSLRLGDAIDGLRELSHGLHPTALFDGGLASALRTLARRNPIPVDLRIALSLPRYEEPVEVAAYYVVSEALANATKHAHASSVTVELRDDFDWLALTVHDDGRGNADPERGSGLTGLSDRVEAIGGTFGLDSPTAHGTTIQVRLPLGVERSPRRRPRRPRPAHLLW